MIYTERNTGRKYNLVKVFVAVGGSHMETRTGRTYNLIKRYI